MDILESKLKAINAEMNEVADRLEVVLSEIREDVDELMWPEIIYE